MVTAIIFFFYFPANAKVDYGRCEEGGVRASEGKEEKLSPIKGCLIHTNRYSSGRLCLMRDYHNRYHRYIATKIIIIVCGSTRCCCLEFVRLAVTFELAPKLLASPVTLEDHIIWV